MVSAAQAPSYIKSYGWGRGPWEMFKDVFDPFGVADGMGDDPFVDDGGSNICDPTGGNCA